MKPEDFRRIAAGEARKHGKTATYEILGTAYLRPGVFVLTMRITTRYQEADEVRKRIEDRIIYGWNGSWKGSFVIQGASHREA